MHSNQRCWDIAHSRPGLGRSLSASHSRTSGTTRTGQGSNIRGRRGRGRGDSVVRRPELEYADVSRQLSIMRYMSLPDRLVWGVKVSVRERIEYEYELIFLHWLICISSFFFFPHWSRWWAWWARQAECGLSKEERQRTRTECTAECNTVVVITEPPLTGWRLCPCS